jgi:hypothetical protein
MPTPEQEIADITAQCSRIDRLLATGVSSHSVDGVSVSIDLNFLRRQRATLAERLATLENPPASPKPRRLLNTIDLSKFAP